jgi:hypothetical protein
MEGTQRQLLRLAGLLLALAGLAERVAGCSAPVRHLVLWLLRRGAAVARDHVLALTGRVACEPVSAMPPVAGADEALRLATTFRALAALLAAFAEAAALASMSATRPAMEARPASAGALRRLAGLACAVERRDSS